MTTECSNLGGAEGQGEGGAAVAVEVFGRGGFVGDGAVDGGDAADAVEVFADDGVEDMRSLRSSKAIMSLEKSSILP